MDSEKLTSLATCLASGGSISEWSTRSGVPRRTAYRWATDATVKEQVQILRQGLVSVAVGQLANAAGAAVATLQGLLAENQPPGIRLGAAKAILSALLDLQNHAEFGERITRLERSGEWEETPHPYALVDAPGDPPNIALDPPDADQADAEPDPVAEVPADEEAGSARVIPPAEADPPRPALVSLLSLSQSPTRTGPARPVSGDSDHEAEPPAVPGRSTPPESLPTVEASHTDRPTPTPTDTSKVGYSNGR